MNIFKVEKRNDHAKAKQLRRAGFVPCCLYGGSLKESVALQMDVQTAAQLFRVKRIGSKVDLLFEGSLIYALLKEKKKNPLNTVMEHIGFQALEPEQMVNSVAHIVLENADTVSGILEQMIFAVPFSSLPADMIDTVIINLDGMAAGTILTVDDIPELKSARIELQIKRDSPVLRISDKK